MNKDRLRFMPAFPFFVVMMFVLSLTTILEKIFGTQWVTTYVYQSWWFILLWSLIVCFSIFNICNNRTVLKNISVLLLHIGLVVILIGAFVTHLTGKQGLIHLRMDSDTQSSIDLPFRIELEKFDIQTYPNTDAPSDFVSQIRVWDEIGTRGGIISMNHIFSHKKYRLYQSSFDDDGKGSWLSVNYDPIGIPLTYIGYVILALGFLMVLFKHFPRASLFNGLMYAVMSFLFNHYKQTNAVADETIPVLRSSLIGWHVSAFIIGYTLLMVMAVISIVALFNVKISHRLMQWNKLLLFQAEAMLCAGIFLGAIWANISWGRYWAWDPKEVWALITLMAYALPFHVKSVSFFRSERKFHVFFIAAVLLVVMTYFGVNYLLGGMHSYGVE